MSDVVPSRPLINMYSSYTDEEIMNVDPYDLVRDNLIGNLENIVEDMKRRWPNVLALMIAGDLSDEAEELLDANGERLYAFLSNLDNDFSDYFRFDDEEVAEAFEYGPQNLRPEAG